MSKRIETLESQLSNLQSELHREREHPISQDDFSRWLDNRITLTFFRELSERYLSNLTDEPVVLASLERVDINEFLPHTNPVSETAIKAAVKSGRNAELVELMEWEPENLDKEEKEDE